MSKDAETSRDPHPNTELSIPGFTVEGLLGEGGMGLVYRATQHKPRRAVALKLLKPNVVTPRTLRRFEREAEILARLQHPGIARVYETGVTTRLGHAGSASVPYFVMELIEGVGLKQHAEQKGLTVRERMGLFAEVCDAVHYAHQQGVVHRDLKPANILVDLAGNSKVLDFGIARASGGDQPLTTLRTDIGQLLGTLPYMSPEQAVGDPDSADERSDVYALGVTLYEFLSGHLPYRVNTASLVEAARVIRDEEPVPLSGMDRTLRGDIETIVGRCLEKEPQRRYASAEALARDIRRYLASEPIQARPPTGWYQATRFAKRNKALVAGLAAVFVTLLLGMVGTSLGRSAALEAKASEAEQRVIAERRRIEAEQAAQRAAASEQAMAEALAEEKRMRRLADEQRRLATNKGRLYTQMIKGVRPEVSRGRDIGLLIDMMARGEREAAELLEAYPEDESLLRYEIGSAYLSLGMNKKAKEQLQRAYTLALESHGPASPHTLDCLLLLGNTTMEMAEFNESIGYNNQAIAGIRRIHGMDSDRFVTAMHNLGNSYSRLDRLEETIAINDALICLYPFVPGATRERAIDFEVTKAIMLMQFGNMDQAQNILKPIYEEQLEHHGLAHHNTLHTGVHLAWTMIESGETRPAIQLLGQLAKPTETFYRDDPRMLLRLDDALTSAYMADGQIDRAITILNQQLDFCRRAFGEEHPDTLKVYLKLGECHGAIGQYDKARSYVNRSVEANIVRQGMHHPHTLGGFYELGRLNTKAGDYEEAEKLFDTYIHFASEAWGENFISVFRARLLRGMCILDSGDTKRADRIAVSLYQDAVAEYGHDHALTSEFAVFYASRLLAQSKLDEAEVVLLDATDAMKRAPKGAIANLRRWRIDAAEMLVEVYRQLGLTEHESSWRTEVENLRRVAENTTSATR